MRTHPSTPPPTAILTEEGRNISNNNENTHRSSRNILGIS